MRHQKARSLNNRFTSWRKATLISLLKNLLIHQSIKTTKVRASSVQPLVEKIIGLAKENSLAAKRRAYRVLGEHDLVSKLFNEIGPRFKERSSGFTRVLNLGLRRGDGARLVVLEFTEIKKKEIKKAKKEKAASPKDEQHIKPAAQQPPSEEKKAKTTEVAPPKEEKPTVAKKPSKQFLGGLRRLFKKERDSL